MGRRAQRAAPASVASSCRPGPLHAEGPVAQSAWPTEANCLGNRRMPDGPMQGQVLCDAGWSVDSFRANSSRAEWREVRPERSRYPAADRLAETCRGFGPARKEPERSEALAVTRRGFMTFTRKPRRVTWPRSGQQAGTKRRHGRGEGGHHTAADNALSEWRGTRGVDRCIIRTPFASGDGDVNFDAHSVTHTARSQQLRPRHQGFPVRQ